MPNLPTHLSLALQTAREMTDPGIDRYLGRFLLGSTSPDIRIMTKWKRDQTHFAPLTVEQVGTGVEGLLQAHPHLLDSDEVNDETRVFLSGYFTHLVADESWIVDIYVPYLGGNHLQSDQVKANICDRAIQLDMDRVAKEELGDGKQVGSLLRSSEENVNTGFIEAETLARWREWVTEFITWEFDWERLRFATARIYPNDVGADEMVEEFLQSMPSSLERAYSRIHGEEMTTYRETVVGNSIRLIKEYLGVPESS